MYVCMYACTYVLGCQRGWQTCVVGLRLEQQETHGRVRFCGHESVNVAKHTNTVNTLQQPVLKTVGSLAVFPKHRQFFILRSNTFLF